MRRHPSQPRQSAGRWRSRALLVLGGAVAGTAAAWALSASPASASTAVDPGFGGEIQPVAETAAAGVDDLTSGVSKLAGAAAEAPEKLAAHVDPSESTEPDAQPNATGAGDEADEAEPQPAEPSNSAEPSDVDAGELNAAMQRFAGEAVLRPAGRTLQAVLHLLSDPQDAPSMIRDALTPPEQVGDFGRNMWEFFHPGDTGKLLPSPDAPSGGSGPGLALVPGQNAPNAPTAVRQVAQETTSDSADAIYPVRGVQQTDFTHAIQRHDDTAPQSPMSPPRAPLALPSVPSGASSGSHADSPQFGYPTAASSAFDPAAIGYVRSGVRSLLLQPERQPGVTPD